jgi:hypothetical protein
MIFNFSIVNNSPYCFLIVVNIYDNTSELPDKIYMSIFGRSCSETDKILLELIKIR